MSSSHTVVIMESRRKLGIFYTPDELARKMSQWAIRSPMATVLDPSFGGCAFLRGAVEQLRELRSPRPARQVFGADRDPGAKDWLASILREGARQDQFYFGDFMSIPPSHFATLFSAVLGNPPYVKHHALPSRLQHVAARTLATNGQQLSAMASYWAYFVLHAINFIAPGGRLALILPGSLIHTEYAYAVRKALRNAFGRVTAILLLERVFADAEEESVLVFAEGRSEPGGDIRVGLASWLSLPFDEDSLERISRPLDRTEQEDSWIRPLLDSRILTVYDQAATQCARLADKATVRIGTVTGANRFFVLKPSALHSLSLFRKHTKPILSRAAFVRGLSFNRTSLEELKETDATCLLLHPPRRIDLHPRLRTYLRQGVEEQIPTRVKCALRKPWYRVKTGRVPDAFLTYMAGTCPRLVLNEAGIPCTNAIHALTWQKSVSKKEELTIVVSFLSTLTQLSAELEGRSYGGGVLKLEPSEAGRLVIPAVSLAGVQRLFSDLHLLCLQGEYDKATEAVDELLLKNLLTRAELTLLKLGVEMLRKRRLERCAVFMDK